MSKIKDDQEKFNEGVNRALESDIFDRLMDRFDFIKDPNSPEERGYQHGLKLRPHISDLLKGLYKKPENKDLKIKVILIGVAFSLYFGYCAINNSFHSKINESSKSHLETIVNETASATYGISPQKSLNSHY